MLLCQEELKMALELDISKIKGYSDSKGWSEVALARKLNLDYSFVYRVFRGERKPGAKFILNFMELCLKEGMSPYSFM